MPTERPLTLTTVFTKGPAKQTQWKAIVAQSGLVAVAPSLDQTGETIWTLVGPFLR